MGKNNSFSGDYIKLFIKREGKVVMGRHCSNLFLLTLVLTLTFMAISFSNASLNYLSFKMNDPFINWVDIQNDYGEGDISGLLDGLSDSTIMAEYHFVDNQVDYSNHYMFFGKNSQQIQYFNCRFFQSFKGNPLLEAILGEDNVVDHCSLPVSELEDECIGLIVTQDVIRKLGYNETPAFIDLCRYSAGADTLGFELFEDFAHIPIPVIGVVKRLPMKMDVISTRYFYEQQRNDITYPFNLNNREYATSLYYHVPADINIEEFKNDLNSFSADSCFVGTGSMPYIKTFKKGSIVSLKGYSSEIAPEDAWEIDRKIKKRYEGADLYRLYDYNFKNYSLPLGSNISIQFSDLDRIRDFETYVKDNYKVQIEMSQINAKENFNSVSVMANILSWAIIIFSIICIILFVVNLFQSYFQKVKKNMGTFKAFGISNFDLISVYVLIMLITIVSSILIALGITYIVELLLPIFHIMKDGTFSYLTLWNDKTIYSVLIIILCSVATVYFVMKKLLSATPGDLIYDRQ